jgi:CheY-like chemotaxis protein
VGLVLIVDDHADFRRLARRILEGAGFVVAEAGTGAEAVAVVGELRPDAVLLDIQLPDLDGFAVAGRLADLADTGHRPAVVLTSSREASDYGGRIAASPVTGFLPKTELSGASFRTLLASAR